MAHDQINTTSCCFCILSDSRMQKESDFSNASEGIVSFAGEPAVDGCGWLLTIDNETFFPVNMNEEYRIKGLRVQLVYETVSTTRNHCDWWGTGKGGYRSINLKRIRKAQ
jgi:hypothetical protein